MTDSTDQPTVLAFGTGVFLRAFLCDFADKAGVSVTLVASTPEGDNRVARLMERGGRFTLAKRGIDARSGQIIDTWREIGSVTRAISASTAWDDVLATAHDPNIAVVASNVTESALKLADDPAGDQPELSPPASFPARLTRWLYERFSAGLPGVIVLPCELVEGNGTILRGFVLDLATRWTLGEAFVHWLKSECVIADTLVDRIVPGVPAESDRALWSQRLNGDDDPLLTIAEPFALWAIQGDDSVAERLRWLIDGSDGAAVVTPDITPYVLRKVRMLNGLHTAMASIAIPKYGLATVRESIEHSELGPFLHAMLFEEIVPANVPPLAELDALAYAEATWARMSNPFLVHRLSDIAKGAPVKWRTRLWPTIQAYEARFNEAPARITECRAAFEASE